MTLFAFSGLLVLLPLSGFLYHRLRRSPTDYVALVVLFSASVVSGFLAAGVEAGIWSLILVQLVIVIPATVWGFGRRQSMERERC